MKKLLWLAFLVFQTAPLMAQTEVITGFDTQTDLPKLNDEMRKDDATVAALEARVAALEANPGVQAATQAEQETGSSTTVYVSPGRQKFSASAAKAWCRFNGATVGTNAPTAGYNVTSVQRTGAGLYTITFTTAFSGTGYNVVGSASNTGTTSGLFVYPITIAAGTCAIGTTNSVDALTDGDSVNLAFYGDQ